MVAYIFQKSSFIIIRTSFSKFRTLQMYEPSKSYQKTFILNCQKKKQIITTHKANYQQYKNIIVQ